MQCLDKHSLKVCVGCAMSWHARESGPDAGERERGYSTQPLLGPVHPTMCRFLCFGRLSLISACAQGPWHSMPADRGVALCPAPTRGLVESSAPD